MTYQEIIESVSIILETDKIYKVGLTLTYELNEQNHKEINDILFYKSNPVSMEPVYNDEFIMQIGGINLKFIKINK
jgi:hypothetical protein